MTAMPATSPPAPLRDELGEYAVSPALVAALSRMVVAGPRATRHTSHTPMSGAPLAEVPESSVADVAMAIDQGRAAQRSWARRPIAVRAQVMLRLHDLVLQHQGTLLDLIQLESGKARAHAFEEIADVAITARYYARTAADHLATRHTLGALLALSRTETVRHPHGVVGIVSPWNFPLSLPITDTIPALMAGNAVVLRPDSQTALSALYGAMLLRDAGLPDGVLQVVVGAGATIGQAVVDRADYVSYTGSTETGRRVGESAASRLVGCSLELGGKNSLYVRPDADLAVAVEGVRRATYASGGQLCMHGERLLLHEAIADEFLARFLPSVEAMRVGTALEFGFEMGSLLSQRQLDRVDGHVRDAVERGARVLAGGRPLPEIGPFCYAPTVLDGVTPDMACRDEETFGPVLAVYRVASDEEAVRLANDTAYGLHAGIWSRDVPGARAVARRIRTGTVSINEGYAASWSSLGSPMGGMKQSGLGRRHGAEGILKYTESQSITAQHLVTFGPQFGLSDKQFAGLFTVGLKALKALGAK